MKIYFDDILTWLEALKNQQFTGMNNEIVHLDNDTQWASEIIDNAISAITAAKLMIKNDKGE